MLGAMSEEPIFIPGEIPGERYGARGDRAPEIVILFRIYAGLFMLGGLAGVGMGIFMMIQGNVSGMPASEAIVAGVTYSVLGVASIVLHGLALFGGRRPWVHTLALVVIALGCLSCCTIFFSIPLLIGWSKPPVKAWYNPPPPADDLSM